MLFFENIQSVSKYESKLLFRSWFFKVFLVLTLFYAIFVSIVATGEIDGIERIPSILPGFMLFFFNIGQAVISIFLASEYLKRDKQLDTSEVFYVRPLSNAEYLLGKMWGTIRVFLLLNFLVIAITAIVGYVKLKTDIDISSYFIYLFLINIPTLIYIVGLSTLLMLLIKNQALTFVVLLGYIGLTVFYIGEKCYYLFDYIGYNMPMFKSTVTGFADLEALINHRLLYFLLGCAAILCSILFFRRLPNSHRALRPWKFLSFLFFALSGWCVYRHLNAYWDKNRVQQQMVELNNQHVHDPKMTVDSCHIDVVQREDDLHITARILGKALNNSSKFTFTLNPGLKVISAVCEGHPLDYERESHLLRLCFPKELRKDETIWFTLEYEGVVDERICYLDIPEELQIEQNKVRSVPFNVGKRYAYQSADYTLLTPETYWYPRPGVCYSSTSPDWQQVYFTHFDMTVQPRAGLTALSQGKRDYAADSSKVAFHSSYPLQSISLIIGDYKNISVEVDSVDYELWYFDKHDFFKADFDSISDTIPSIIREFRNRVENTEFKMTYPFDRFMWIETPLQFFTYTRIWTRAQETVQPEMLLLPEMVMKDWNYHIKWMRQWNKYEERRGGRVRTEKEIQSDAFNDMFWSMIQTVSDFNFESGMLGRSSMMAKSNPYYIFPQFYNFKYNVYSSEWPVANRMVELLVESNGRVRNNTNWMRNFNGLSNDEKSLLLMQERPFKELLSDVDHRDLVDNLVNLQREKTFLEANINIGVQAFKDSIIKHVTDNVFLNLSFEALLDTLGNIADVDLKAPLQQWSQPLELAEFVFGTPRFKKVDLFDKEIYQVEIAISNISNVKGYIDLKMVFWGDESTTQPFDGEEKPVEWIVEFEPHQTKRIVSHWEESAPNGIRINTMFSKNLPMEIFTRLDKAEEALTLNDEGEFVINYDMLSDENEIIVDNEDSLLFKLSDPLPSGYFNEWIERKSKEEDFKYVGVQPWRVPSRWTATTDGRYYGQSVRSAYVIRSGDGRQFAKWSVPIPESGRYDLYYHVKVPDEVRWRDRRRGGKNTYHFLIKNGEEEDEVEINLKKVEDGWVQLGTTLRIDSDTIYVTLSDKTTDVRMVIADAVKLVRK